MGIRILFRVFLDESHRMTPLSSPQLRGAAFAVEASRDGIEPLLWNAKLVSPSTPFAASIGRAGR
jgi:hypothetical protein